MKATGIVRRIDDLGRVVIPKEIRRTQLIRVGDPLEIYVSGNNEVIFKKYSPMGELNTLAQSYVDILYKNMGIMAIVTDRDHVIAACTTLRETLEKRITKSYEGIVELRRATVTSENPIIICDDALFYARAIAPVICQGDIIGSVAFVDLTSDAINSNYEINVQNALSHINVAALVMGRQMED